MFFYLARELRLSKAGPAHRTVRRIAKNLSPERKAEFAKPVYCIEQHNLPFVRRLFGEASIRI
jgi:hypothetical protein